MSDTRGGDSERIAPIIPLFGDASRSPRTAPSVPPGVEAGRERTVAAKHPGDTGLWRSTWDGPSASPGDESDAGSPSERHPARGAAGRRSAAADSTETPKTPRLRALQSSRDEPEQTSEPTADNLRAAAEEALVRKLRARSLSVSEARLILRGHGLRSEQIDDVVDEFQQRGYLDDAVLADMLVTSGVERKGQGRVALSRALAQRGIPREVIDAALDELPDDDSERALEFARSKARSMGRLDHDTALRRLVGQLSRRGYNGLVAMTAAKAALNEITNPGASGVRFVDSD